jgi:sugar-specific transcriptional regulator TrmB
LQRTSVKLNAESTSAQDEIVARLRELGLSSYAARSFVALLGRAPISATGICRLTGIPDSKIYYALEELNAAHLIEPQHGTPTMYRPVPLERAIAHLLQTEKQRHENRLKLVELLRRKAEPLAKTRAEPGELELAYIVKGKAGIVKRMSTLIDESRKEVIALLDDEHIWNGIKDSLVQARKRRVKVGLALSTKIEGQTRFGEARRLTCDCNILIADSERLVTVSHVSGAEAYAVVTSDPGMIRISKGYYESPTCCPRI